MDLTPVQRARDILSRKDETIYESHAFLFPLIADLVMEIMTKDAAIQILKDAINNDGSAR